MLENTVNNILNHKRQNKIEQLQKRIDIMSEKWWSEKMQKAFEIMEYYYKKSDETARNKVIALKIERMQEIYEGYQNILKQAEQEQTFDIFSALEELKKKIAVYDNELNKWRKKFHYDKEGEAYDFYLKENNL